jgi:hypothetical protein
MKTKNSKLIFNKRQKYNKKKKEIKSLQIKDRNICETILNNRVGNLLAMKRKKQNTNPKL